MMVKKGRPREFEVEAALEAAMRVFWKKGYEGASLPELTEAMGISRPSLYAAFGNKEALFRRAIDRYVEGPASFVGKAVEAGTAREVVEKVFAGTIELVVNAGNPRGCFLVQSALACGDAGNCLRKETARRRAGGEAILKRRFERAIAEGDLRGEVDAGSLAKYVMTVAHGMAVQAVGGASCAELRKVAEVAMRGV